MRKYDKKETIEKQCPHCGITFFGTQRKIFCRRKCRNQYMTTQKNNINVKLDLSSGSIGAVAELMVCSDLLIRGYEVFRAVSATCSTDIIALKNDIMTKIEVRTGFYRVTGQVYWPEKRIRSPIVAVVTHVDKTIHYIPGLP